MTTWMATTLAKIQINHMGQPCYISNKITDFQVEFEDTKGAIRNRISKNNRMAQRESAKGQTTIDKAYI